MKRSIIVRKAKDLIIKDGIDLSIMMPGMVEQIQDKYIEKVCIESGYTFSEFCNYDGKKLNKLEKIFNSI